MDEHSTDRQDFDERSRLQRIERHLVDIKLIAVLILLTIVYPPLGWIAIALAILIAVSAFFGTLLATLINLFRR